MPITLELAGQRVQQTVPVTVELSAAELAVAARFRVRQSDFGIEPFSVMGGALSVADEVDVALRILARRVESSSEAGDSGGC